MSVSGLSTQDYWLLFFTLVTVGCLLLTIRELRRGSSPVQVLLLSALTLYAVACTLDRFSQIVHVKRLSAIPVGILGVITYFRGHSTDLPIFLILLGVGGLVDLIRDRLDGNGESF